MNTMRGRAVATYTLIACLSVSVQAQGHNQRMGGAPRTPDGKINMMGPVPMLNGKPDLSGIWQVQAEPRAPGGLFGLGESPNSKYFRNILSDFPGDALPLTPAGAELLRKHTEPGAFNPTLNCLPDGVPHGDLLPEPFKIIHSPGKSSRMDGSFLPIRLRHGRATRSAAGKATRWSSTPRVSTIAAGSTHAERATARTCASRSASAAATTVIWI